MIRRKLLQSNNLLLLFISLTCGLLIPFLSIEASLLDIYNFEQILVTIREKWIVPGRFTGELMVAVIPICLLTMFITNHVADDYAIVKNYVFIRSKNIKQWFLSNMALVGICSFFSAVFYNLGIVIISFLFKFEIQNVRLLIEVLAYSTITIFLIVFIMSLQATVIAFLYNVKSAVLFSISFIVVSFVLATALPARFSKWIWISHFFINWHNPNSEMMLQLNGVFFENGSTYSFGFSILFLIGFFLFAAAADYFIMRKVDYL